MSFTCLHKQLAVELQDMRETLGNLFPVSFSDVCCLLLGGILSAAFLAQASGESCTLKQCDQTNDIKVKGHLNVHRVGVQLCNL